MIIALGPVKVRQNRAQSADRKTERKREKERDRKRGGLEKKCVYRKIEERGSRAID